MTGYIEWGIKKTECKIVENYGKSPGFSGKLMLIGEYKHIIDTKKRLSLPAKFRKEIGRKVIVTRGFENCLVVYPEKVWEAVRGKLEGLPTSQISVRRFNRIILAGAMEVFLDKLGRILIPDYLKKYAGLKKNVIICGLSNKLEVWDIQKWELYRKRAEKEIEKVAQDLPELGI